MTEADLKAPLAKELAIRHQKWVRIGHEDVRRPGVPDWSLAGWGAASWWEFKLGKPLFKSRGDQELMCLRLDAAMARCRYVVWLDDGEARSTLVLRPPAMLKVRRLSGSRRDARELIPFAEEVFRGFDHFSVVSYMERTHLL